jgi:hypothetical protein
MTICRIKCVASSGYLLNCIILLKIIVGILNRAKSICLCMLCLHWSWNTAYITFLSWSNLLSHALSNIKIHVWVVQINPWCTSSNTYNIVLDIELVFLMVKIVLSKCKSRHVFICKRVLSWILGHICELWLLYKFLT